MPTLNVRLAAIIMVSVLVLGGSVAFLHGYQVDRQANFLKKESERAEEDHKAALAKAESATKPDDKIAANSDAAKDLKEAIRLLRDYAMLARRDRGAELHLGLLYAEMGQLGAARDWLEEGLRYADESVPSLKPEDVRDARWKLVKDVEMKMRQFSDAQEHLKVLLDGAVEKNQRHRRNKEKPEGDAEQLDLYGEILLRVNLKPKEAAEVFKDAIDVAPDQVDAYLGLAEARMQLNEKPKAEEVMDSMLAKNPKSVAAVERYVNYYLGQAEKTADEKQRTAVLNMALAKAQKALDNSPDNPRCFMLVGRCYIVKQDYDKAEEYLRKGIKAYKESDDPATSYLLLVDVLRRLNRADDEMKALKEGVAATRGTAGGLELQWQLAEAQVLAGNVKEAEALTKDLRGENYPPGRTDFLAALIAMQQQNWPAAEKLLQESVIPRTRDWPYIRTQAKLNLVQCYRQLGHNVNEQVRLLQEILKDNPHIYHAHAWLAEIYTAQRRTDLANEELRLAANCLPANSPQQEDAALRYLQSLVSIQLRTEEHKRNWEHIEQLIDKYTKDKAPRPEYVVLKAEVLLGQGKTEKAREEMEKCTREKPNSAAVWLALVRLAMQQAGKETDAAKKAEDWQAAANYIDGAEKALGNGLIVRMARGNLALAKKDPQVSHVLRSLSEKTDNLTESEKIKLLAILGGMSDQAGDIDLAQAFCRQQAEKEPKNALVRCHLCELQLRNFEKGRPVDMQELDRLVDEIAQLSEKKKEKDEPETVDPQKAPLWLYAKAVRAFVQAKNKDPQLLLEARGYVQEALKTRSDWAALVVLAGRICELQNDADDALKLYMYAIYYLGEHDNDIIGRTVRLLVPRRRLSEAKALFDVLEMQKSPLLEEMRQEYVFVQVFRGKDEEISKAEALVDNFVAADSRNDKDLYWQGEMYAVLANRLKTMAQKAAAEAKNAAENAQNGAPGKTPEEWKQDASDSAGKAKKLGGEMIAMAQKGNASLYKALDLNPQAENVWIARVQLFVDAGQPDAAKPWIGVMEARLKSEQALPTIARCCELLNEPDKAEQKYQAAMKAFPQNSRVLRQSAGFYLRNKKPASAEPLLRAITDLQSPAALTDACWARQRLAEILAARGSFDDLCRAIALLDENLKSKAPTMEDLRLKARFLLADPRKEAFGEALKCYEIMVNNKELSPYATADDHYRLAQLYLHADNKPAYEDQMHSIIGGDRPQPEYLMSYIVTLLDRKELEDADKWLQVLEKSVPDGYDTMHFRAEYLFLKGQYRDIIAKAEKYIDDLDPKSPDRLRQIHLVARMMESFADRLKAQNKPESSDFIGKADALYQSLRRLAADGHTVYAQYCARQGRIDEALAVLDQSWDRNKPEQLQMPVAAIVSSPKTTPEQFAQLEKFLVAAKQTKYSAALLMALAGLHEQQRKYDKAIEDYREILAKEPRNFVVLNNLAVDLVRNGGDLKEALNDVNQAVEIKGPLAAIRDSRAVVYIARQEYDKALDDINAAIRDEGSAEQYFHQAWVLNLMDRKGEAAEAMKTAQSKGLDPKGLSSYERPVYERLKESL